MDHPLASDSLLVDGCIHVEVPDVKPRGTYCRSCVHAPTPKINPQSLRLRGAADSYDSPGFPPLQPEAKQLPPGFPPTPISSSPPISPSFWTSR